MRRTAMPIWRAALAYTWFDVRSLTRWRLVLMVGMPLPMLAVFMVVSSQSADVEVDAVLLVAPNTAVASSLRDWFDDSDDDVQVVQATPGHVNDLLDDDLTLLATIPDDFETLGVVDVERSEHTPVYKQQRLYDALISWQIMRLATASGGDLPRIKLTETQGEVSDFEENDATSGWQLSSVRYALGILLIGLLGGLGAAGGGLGLSESRSKGFNHVLAVGTPRLAIYASELLTGAAMMALQSLVWWGAYGLGVGFAVRSGLVAQPSLAEVWLDLPMVTVLLVLSFLQVIAASAGVLQVFESVPKKVKDQARSMAMLVFFVTMTFAPDSLDTALISQLCWFPLTGPLAAWFHFVDGGSWMAAILLLQAVYAAVAVMLGNWLHGLDETPQAHLRRRYWSPTP